MRKGDIQVNLWKLARMEKRIVMQKKCDKPRASKFNEYCTVQHYSKLKGKYCFYSARPAKGRKCKNSLKLILNCKLDGRKPLDSIEALYYSL